MLQAVDYIIGNSHGGKFAEPPLDAMYDVSESFYRSTITHAHRNAAEDKRAQQGKRKLAARRYNSPIVPKLRDLESVFRDRRFWPSMMKRSEQLTERLRRSYLQKLRRKFRDVWPRIQSGDISPDEAKKSMMQAWDASKSRVNTIFRTETTTYFAKTQVAFFEDDDEIIGFLFDSVADSDRTSWCRSRHGLIYRPGTELLRRNTPSCHWHCRSHLIPLANTPHNRRLLEDPDRDPEKRTVVPLPPGWVK